MERFPEKVKRARIVAHISQEELGQLIGVSRRAVTAYEIGASIPRRKKLRRLAEVLQVTEEYLTDDSTDNPEAGRFREERIARAREKFKGKGAKEAEELMRRNMAFLAGGSVDQEAKDAFFDALMTAYITCKEEARKKFTPNSAKNGDGKSAKGSDGK